MTIVLEGLRSILWYSRNSGCFMLKTREHLQASDRSFHAKTPSPF